jgi:iron-sulfur cluster repair protein YtfE (RIC family)
MNTDDIGAKILSEHKDLRALLQALDRHVQQPVGSDAWLENLRETLSGLVDLCSEHFRLEEQAGLHVQIREQSPRLASRLEKLLSDHRRILDALRKLVADLPRESIASSEADPLKERVLGVLEAVHEHEQAENEVMMDAYWVDLGGEAG